MKRVFLLAVLLGAGLPIFGIAPAHCFQRVDTRPTNPTNAHRSNIAQVQPVLEVDEAEILRRGNHVQHVTADSIEDDGEPTYEAAMAVPADDNHKWFVTVIKTKNCRACAELSQAFRSHRELMAFANPDDYKRSWSSYHEYSIEDESQAWRWRGIRIRAYPTIVVQPPRNGQYGDAKTVVYQGEYKGDPAKLAAAIRKSIKAYVDRLRPRHAQQDRSAQPPVRSGHRAGHNQDPDDIAGPPPWTPEPKVEPAPVTPSVLPVFPWDDDPDQKKPATPDSSSEIPIYPEAVIVVDPDDVESVDFKQLGERIRAARGGQLKVRLLDWIKGRETYNVRRDEVPAVVITAEGRIIEKITRRFLPLIAPNATPQTPAGLDADGALKIIQQIGPYLPALIDLLNQKTPAPVTTPVIGPPGTPAPAPNVTPAPPVLDGFPWAALISALTSGGNPLVLGAAGIALGVWGLRALRRRRQAAGKPLVLDDATFNAILGRLDALNTDQLSDLLGKLLPKFAQKKESVVAAHSSAVSTLAQPGPAAGSPPTATVA